MQNMPPEDNQAADEQHRYHRLGKAAPRPQVEAARRGYEDALKTQRLGD